MNPADLMPLYGIVQKVESNPLRLAQRFIGLGSDEVSSGIPAWAWVVGALGVGAVAGVVLAPKLAMIRNSGHRGANRQRKVFGRYR